MIDDNDIKKLMDVFPTRTELNTRLDEFPTRAELNTRFDEFPTTTELNHRLDAFATKADLQEGLHETTQVLLEAMDKITQGMDAVKHEYTAIGLQLDRHINDKSVHV